MFKRSIISLLAVAAVTTATLTGCGLMKDGSDAQDGTDAEGRAVLKVAALEAAYGKDVWREICEDFEDIHEDVKIELVTDKNLEDVIGAKMKAGDYPDVVYLGTGRPAGLTETMIKDSAILELGDFEDMKIPGEDKKIGDKLLDNFTTTRATNPYGGDKTYLAPIFYSPCGLFYDEGIFEKKGWEVPQTWEEMWALGDKARADGIYLFTYPTAGYMDSLMYALLAEAGGMDFYNDCMSYKDGVWESDEAKTAFDIAAKLLSYAHPTTSANANNENYLKNQQLILDGKALFMPNGTWVVGEMEEAPRGDDFSWGFMALPSIGNGDRYSYNYFEQVWIPKKAKNTDMAKEFIAYLYSDEAIETFAKAGAAQPVKGVTDKLEESQRLFYSIYDKGAKGVMGQFAATDPVEGVSISASLFESANSVLTGDRTADEWRARVEEASDKLRAALK